MEFTNLMRRAFVTYLETREILPTDDIQALLARQRAETPQMGRLALEQHLLNMKQVFVILERQTKTGKLFGEQAVELGYLDPWHISLLLQSQKESQPPVSDILLKMKLCSPQELAQWRHRFQQDASALPL
jgi:hypothetical protein